MGLLQKPMSGPMNRTDVLHSLMVDETHHCEFNGKRKFGIVLWIRFLR
jgi:hypothetical protein